MQNISRKYLFYKSRTKIFSLLQKLCNPMTPTKMTRYAVSLLYLCISSTIHICNNWLLLAIVCLCLLSKMLRGCPRVRPKHKHSRIKWRIELQRTYDIWVFWLLGSLKFKFINLKAACCWNKNQQETDYSASASITGSTNTTYVVP